MSMSDQLPKSPLQTWKDLHNVISLPESEGGPLHSSWLEYQQALDSGQDHHLASRLVMPVNLSDLTTNDILHQSLSGSSESADLSLFLGSKLKRQLENTGSTLYSLTWKKKATPAGRLYYQLVASGRRRKDKESSLARGWATPTARGWKDYGNLRKSFYRKDGKFRNDTLYRQMWLHVYGLHGNPTLVQIKNLESYQSDLARQLMGYPPEWDDCAVMAMP